mmetsp:Transcript_120447/g.209690  ORF Transcript_120447/g.209690 Transcript_120447/m.209690 type:complete len:256 (+) Transcript_120447:2698-3465(+)
MPNLTDSNDCSLSCKGGLHFTGSYILSNPAAGGSNNSFHQAAQAPLCPKPINVIILQLDATALAQIGHPDGRAAEDQQIVRENDMLVPLLLAVEGDGSLGCLGDDALQCNCGILLVQTTLVEVRANQRPNGLESHQVLVAVRQHGLARDLQALSCVGDIQDIILVVVEFEVQGTGFTCEGCCLAWLVAGQKCCCKEGHECQATNANRKANQKWREKIRCFPLRCPIGCTNKVFCHLQSCQIATVSNERIVSSEIN